MATDEPSTPIVLVDSSDIHEGKLDELKAAFTELVGFVETNEARPIAYNVYFDRGGSRITVVQVHPDSASVEHHMAIAAPAFRRLAGLLTLRTMDIYGTPSEGLLEQIRAKVELLGTASVIVHDLHAGFARIEER